MDESFCPGCHRHCDLSKPRCGYGKKYAEMVLGDKELEEKADGRAGAAFSADEKLAKDLIHTGKALKRAEKPRAEWLGTLSDDEKAALDVVLHKIAGELGLNLESEKSRSEGRRKAK